VSNLTNNLIVITGWRTAWKIVGGFGIAISLLGFITMIDPPRDIIEQEIEEEHDIDYSENTSTHLDRSPMKMNLRQK
jgi:hypothetical protein